MKKILLLIVLSFVFSNCEKKTDKYVYGIPEEDTSNLLLGLVVKPVLGLTSYGTIQDPVYRLEWKRCAQGQVFRSATSDCQGAQSSTEYTPFDGRYGAQVYTYCNLPGNFCNSLSLPMTLTNTSTTSEAYNTCASERLNGYTDWRVPTYVELAAMAKASKFALLTTFPNIPEDKFWSSTGNENDSSGLTARAVDFGVNYGDDAIVAKDTRLLVRCVRSY
ncbi:MAG: DUF1566 domain-containing protein [Leptospiraceae bacterium]|nr:DUF1566 domain-containing protein [Leptospiraceae bacterium]MCP5510499.1 DUF1566 domain-containing protein [Leptospiraceae bacterium]